MTPVDVGPMIDVGNQDCAGGFVATDQDAVVAATGAGVGGEFVSERLTQVMRVLRERTGDELDNRGSDFGGQSLQTASR